MSKDSRVDRAGARRRPGITGASELGEYEYCRRGWWLAHVKGLPSANLAAMAQGRLDHDAHGRRAWRAYGGPRCAVLILLAGLAAIVAGLCLLGTALGAHL
ncbi:MAG: hypothetical protein QME94_16000 [Anaerolineae bacterium]|nr:hypothetical protein [Anaerolineae bacterium]